MEGDQWTEGGDRGRGFPGGSREKTRFGSGGSGVVGCLLTSTPAGTAASTHAHASSRWSAGRFAQRSSPRTARRAGTCADANASCERGGSMGGEDRGQEDARREIRWTRRRAHLRGLDEVRLHELGHPVRAERRALIAVRPRPRGRGGVRFPARYRVHARGGLTRSDSNRPPGARMHQSPPSRRRSSRSTRCREFDAVSSAAAFSARGTPSRGSRRSRHSARARWAFGPPGSRASRCRVATSPSRWSSRCSRRPSRARPPTRASSSTRPPPPASSGAPSSCRAPRDA